MTGVQALGTAISIFSNLVLFVFVTPPAVCVTVDKVKENMSPVRFKRNEECFKINNEQEKEGCSESFRSLNLFMNEKVFLFCFSVNFEITVNYIIIICVNK